MGCHPSQGGYNLSIIRNKRGNAMTATLQEAIAAVRRGETERAQLLTAEVIRDNPEDANAWYLLSQLVDSDTRRAAYLSKALALDPSHERARAELGIQAAESGPEPIPATEVVAPPTAETTPAAAPDGAPEWLQPLSPEPATAAEVVAPSAAVAAPAQPTPARPRPTPPPPPPRQQSNGALTVLLVLLGLLTLAVLGVLAYLLLF
jgi:ferric-dicitrate binding protein FerR (iron transport regulator)